MAVAARRGARLLPGAGGAGRRRRGAGPAQERALDRRFVGLAGADAHNVLDAGDEDLAVADLAGARRLDDGIDGALDLVVRHHHLDLHFRQEIDHVLGAAVELGMALLAAEALDLGDGQAGDADFGERFAHFVELEGFDDGLDLLHLRSPTGEGHCIVATWKASASPIRSPASIPTNGTRLPASSRSCAMNSSRR